MVRTYEPFFKDSKLNKNVLLLWQGQLASQLGMQAYSIAMMFWLMENTGSSIVMSLALTLSILPNILFGPVAGVLADQFSRKKIIIITDIIRGSVVLGLALMMFSDYYSKPLIVVLFVIVSAINGVSRAFFQPAIDAFIPDLVSKKSLPRTVAFFQSSTQFSTIIGQALGGLLYRVFGAPVLLLLDSISYFLSAISESFIKHDFTAKRSESSLKDKYKQYKAGLVEGLNFVKGCDGMLQTMFFASSVNLFIAPFMLLLPFYVSEQLSVEVHWYGFLLAAMALGSIMGYWFSATLNVLGSRRTFVMFTSMFLLALSLMMLSQSSSPAFSLISIIFSGFSLGTFNLQATTLFQIESPSEMRGRVMSLLMTISSGLLPIGLLISGGLGALTNNDTQLIFGLSSICIAILTVFTCLNSQIRAYTFNSSSVTAPQN